jgi:hypothetical protein
MNFVSDIWIRLAAFLGRDDVLAGLGDPFEQLMQELGGKRVALVGNARALGGHTQGAQIDSRDLIIRINRAPMTSTQSHGMRTDWLALATSVSASAVDKLAPKRLIWTSHKRKRLRPWMVRHAGFVLFPRDRYAAMKVRMGAQPTTGALLIDALVQSDAKSIDLYGFDFFASLSLSGRRTADAVPHDFNAERAFVEALIKSDPRITLHPM